MFEMHSEVDDNVLYTTFTGNVTVSNLHRLEQTALVAARLLDSEFALVTDVSDCTSVTQAAIARLGGVAEKLLDFGLSKEIRIVGEETPGEVQSEFDRVTADQPLRVTLLESTSERAGELADRATC